QFIGSMKIPTQRKPPFDKLRAGRCVGHPARWIPSWGKEEVALPPLKPTEGLSGPPSKTTFPIRVRSGRTVGGGNDDGKEVQGHGYTVDNIASSKRCAFGS